MAPLAGPQSQKRPSYAPEANRPNMVGTVQSSHEQGVPVPSFFACQSLMRDPEQQVDEAEASQKRGSKPQFTYTHRNPYINACTHILHTNTHITHDTHTSHTHITHTHIIHMTHTSHAHITHTSHMHRYTSHKTQNTSINASTHTSHRHHTQDPIYKSMHTHITHTSHTEFHI